MDLFVSGSEPLEQIVDMTPGIMPNDLFWTGQIPRLSFRFNRNGTSATLRLRRYPLVETFQFGGSVAVHGEVDITVHWRSSEPAEKRGNGAAAEPTGMDAFAGDFRSAEAVAQVQGFRPGLHFRARNADSSGFYASMGQMSNGSYLG